MEMSTLCTAFVRVHATIVAGSGRFVNAFRAGYILGSTCNYLQRCFKRKPPSYLYKVPAEAVSSGGSHVSKRLPFLVRMKLAFFGGLRAVDEILT